MFRRQVGSFVAGFAAAAILFGGLAAAGEVLQKEILVTYTPLRYVFDGEEKTPPANQKGFIYNGRTYVPLRFMTEAMGKKVGWDPETFSIYVGRRPSPLPVFWVNPTIEGVGSAKVTYFEEGALSIKGEAMPKAALVSAFVAGPAADDQLHRTTQVEIGHKVPAGTKTLSGTLFVPERYFGQAGERKVAKLVVMNELNQYLYHGGEVSLTEPKLPFRVELQGAERLRFILILYPYQGVPVEGDEVLTAEIGISDLKFE